MPDWDAKPAPAGKSEDEIRAKTERSFAFWQERAARRSEGE